MTFVQRFDSALRLNVHLHTLVPDGVYVPQEDGNLVFHALGEPSLHDVEWVAHTMAEGVRRLSLRRGQSQDERPADALTLERPVLASCYGASV